MALNTTLSAMIDMLREDVGRSVNVGVGVDDVPSLRRHINRSYALLRHAYDWPHLRHIPTRIRMNAGQRFYDIPNTLDLNTLTQLVAFQGNLPRLLARGVSYEEYAVFDSDHGMTSDPAQKWDLRNDGTATQIEIWPLPASSNETIMLEGSYTAPPLVDDDDECKLDDNLVVLGAAARILKRQGSADADLAISEFNAHLTNIRKGIGPSHRVILGDEHAAMPRRSRVLIVAGR